MEPPPPDVGFVPDQTVEELDFEELLDLVQSQTFKYFWDFAEPVSGMARERMSQPDIIATGGSGLGLACFPVAVERGWITRDQALERLDRVLSFLEGASTYHGAFSHWYNKEGSTLPFSPLDDGGDIVETALLFQGLLINRQYFAEDTAIETAIRDRITGLWEAVEWNWYTQGENSMTWHWSPNHGFEINLKIVGWNEALIVYVLAAASPNYSIDKSVYDRGWADNGNMINGQTYYGITLSLGPDYGGPLFLSQYSFIGLDPRNLEDQYAKYSQQVTAHSLINYRHCIENPFNYEGYGNFSWGLTSSDDPNGYAVHSPTEDTGVITPTASLGSFPFTPIESRQALEYFYYNLNASLWGPYGFYDAFSEHFNWFSSDYIAIDQGPIVAMIENYRSQLLWNNFMNDPDIIQGLNKLGFQ